MDMKGFRKGPGIRLLVILGAVLGVLLSMLASPPAWADTDQGTATPVYSPGEGPERTATPTPTVTCTATPDPWEGKCEYVGLSTNVFRPMRDRRMKIRVRLCAAGWMSLIIYNSAGDVVKVLRKRSYVFHPDQVFRWDGTNDGKDDLASGVYIIRFEGTRSAQTCRFLIVR